MPPPNFIIHKYVICSAVSIKYADEEQPCVIVFSQVINGKLALQKKQLQRGELTDHLTGRGWETGGSGGVGQGGAVSLTLNTSSPSDRLVSVLIEPNIKSAVTSHIKHSPLYIPDFTCLAVCV